MTTYLNMTKISVWTPGTEVCVGPSMMGDFPTPMSRSEFLNCPDCWHNVAEFCSGPEQNTVMLINRGAQTGVGDYRDSFLTGKFSEATFTDFALENIRKIAHIFFANILKPADDPVILARRMNSILKKNTPNIRRMLLH